MNVARMLADESQNFEIHVTKIQKLIIKKNDLLDYCNSK